jgi:3-deoxy-D-manno-octulosonate 8-phosphate phosphatase (KDO 8-P phosphatase)
MTDCASDDLKHRATSIRLVVFDVDGVLTDGRLFVGPAGEEYKQFHVRDGHGMVMLQQVGIELAIISGRDSPAVARRMAELGIRYVYQGCRDKLATLQELMTALALDNKEVCYVGDDLPDLLPLRAVGLPVAVADAHPTILEAAVLVTKTAGGHGAARELAEIILAARSVSNRVTTPRSKK